MFSSLGPAGEGADCSDTQAAVALMHKRSFAEAHPAIGARATELVVSTAGRAVACASSPHLCTRKEREHAPGSATDLVAEGPGVPVIVTSAVSDVQSSGVRGAAKK